jgi:hypothetical protein
MTLHIINGQKIVTNFDYPPIPWRDMDWSATSPDYDAEIFSDGTHRASHPIGTGSTEEEAITDISN